MNLQLDHDTLRAVYAWFRQVYPQEGCGVITKSGEFKAAPNLHPDPYRHFLLPPGFAESHDAAAVLHSHPDGWRCPSRTDMEAQRRQALPWGIVWLSADAIEPPFYWDGTPSNPVGHGWRSGVNDCLNLVRWFYRQQGIDVLDVPRRPMAPDEFRRALRTMPAALGFRGVCDTPAYGDVVAIGRDSPHLGVIMADGRIWHHPSPIEPDFDPQSLPRYVRLEAADRGRMITCRWRHHQHLRLLAA